MNSDSIFSSHFNDFAFWRMRLEEVIRALLLVFIASLPFRQLLVVERNGFLVLLGLLLMWCMVNRRLWFVQTPIDIPLFAWVGWIAVTIPFSLFPDYSLREFGKLLQGVLIFYAVLFFLRRHQHRTWLVYLLVALMTITSIAGIGQFDPANYQATRSFLSSEVWLTTFLVMFIPLAWALAACDNGRWAKAVFVLVAALSTGCLLITQSRAGVVALLAEAWFFAWLYRNRRVRLMVGTMTGLIATVFLIVLYVDSTSAGGPISALRSSIPLRTTTNSVMHRFDIWSFGLSEVAKRPVMGIGYGSEILRMQYPNDAEMGESSRVPFRNVGTHNILLYMALHIGIPGLLLFLWLIAVLLRALSRNLSSSRAHPNAVVLGVGTGVVGLLIRLQFDQMFVGTLAILFWVLVASALLHCSPLNQSRETPDEIL